MVRWSVFLVALLAAPASAQWSLDDPRGDVQLGTDGTGAPVDRPNVDILDVAIRNETKDAFEIWLTKAEWIDSGSIVSCVGGSSDAVYFTFEDVHYVVGLGGGLGVMNAATGQYRLVAALQTLQDGLSHGVIVPKEPVRGADGLSARPGTAIVDVRAETMEIVACEPVAGGSSLQYWDAAPDEGASAEPFHFVLGPGAFGAFTVSTPAPIRSSNGGPDTVVYPLTFSNEEEAASLLLATDGLPDGWTVHHPARVNIGADSSATVSMVVTTRTAHAHGTTESFDLVVSSASGGDIGRYELGIHYLEIPQLAGHHPQLHVHGGNHQLTSFGGTEATFYGWFNTVQDAPDASGLQIWPGEEAEAFVWWLPMDPSLLIGMDFDLETAGTLAARFFDDVGDTYGVAAELLHCAPGAEGGRYGGEYDCDRGSWLLLAEGETSVTISGGGTADVEMALHPDSYADIVPYVDGANIMLRLAATPTRPAASTVEPVRLSSADTWMRLPLLEYRDPVEAGLAEASGLGLTADHTELLVNPGDTTWFHLDLGTDRPRDVVITVVGHNVAWTSVWPEPHIKVHEAQPLAISVQPPASSVDGDFAEFFVIIEDVADPATAVVLKLRATVVASEVDEEPSPAGYSGKGNASPLTPMLPLAAVLAIAARRRRLT